ncbi:MAG: amidase [Pseudomonadota bacterium]
MTSPVTPTTAPPYESIAAFRAHTRAHQDMLEWCAKRIDALNGHLNALREVHHPPISANEGPLRGVPITVKDNIGVTGFETWAGTAAALPPRWAESGELIERLEVAGAVVTSKSHCAEFAFGGSGFNPHHGTPRNPFDPHIHRAPGGSSSGTAVAVASGMAWIGVGTDTGGSVRVPASLCGCVGFRPTHGRWPTDGILPLSPLFDDPGIIARNAADLSLVAAAIDRVNPRAALTLAGVRFATVPDQFLSACDADVQTAWRRACRRAGPSVSSMGGAAQRLLQDAFEMLDNGPNTAASNCARLIEAELPGWRERLTPHVSRLLNEHAGVPEDIIASRHARVRELRAEQATLFGDADFLLCPTCPVSAPAVAMLDNESYYERYSNLLLRYTVFPSLFGCCAVSLPMGRDTHGIPMGLQIIGRDDDDQRLIACARTLEAALNDTAAD